VPEEGKKEESTELYIILQSHLNTINRNYYLILGGDFNTHVGNSPVENTLGTNRENVLNENGKMMINFALWTRNSFFRFKEIHKFMWTALL
jgi:hypothetical protein